MEHLKTLFLLFTALLILSCDKMELRGFVSSYENVNERFTQSIEWNNNIGYKSLETKSNSYSIFCMGDSHIGGTKNIKAFFQITQDHNAIGAVMVGDITTGHESDYEVLKQTLPHSDSVNVFAIAGNHDLYFDGWKSFYSIFGSSSYYFTVKTPTQSDLFICLDTGGGTLGDKQTKWLKDVLQTKRNTYRYCTILTHNNVLRLRGTASTNPMTEEVQVILDLCIRYKVNLFITGHDHQRNTIKFGHTNYIIMDDLQNDNNRATLLKLEFKEADYAYTFLKLDGSEVQP